MSAAPLRVAVVGAGVIGRQHATVAAGLEGYELAAVVDVAPGAADRLADALVADGVTGSRPDVHVDLDEALARDDVDVVAVCVPSGLHADVAVAALGAGRHTIVEKPLDVTLDAGRRIAEAARAAAPGVVASVISQHRFDPGSQVVRAALDAGRLGRVTSAVASLAWFRGQDYYDSGDWRGTWALDGGGALMNQGVHTLDLLLWFLGEPVAVHARTALLAHERMEVEDTLVATVTFASGALATVHATTAAYPGTSARLSVFGSLGSAILDDDELAYFHAADPDGEAVSAYGLTGTTGEHNHAAAELTSLATPPALAGTSGLAAGQARQYADVLECVRDGRPPVVGVGDALTALATVRALYRSAATGTEVAVADVMAAPDAEADPVAAGPVVPDPAAGLAKPSRAP